jgi:arylsulfatase A-like enzyme
MSIVDTRIGEVLDAIPASQLEDTVVIFTSDHGNYAGAHGFPVGKSGTLYDEAYHVPLIVADPSGRFTADIETPRPGLTSSVDMLPMLVTLGHNGGAAWQYGINSLIYDNRHDVVSMLRSAQAPGRDYVLLAANEVLPAENQKRRKHLLALRTQHLKLGTYAKWSEGTTTVSKRSLETEFYDYGTAGGRAEVSNTPDDPRAARALASLLDNLIPNELEAPRQPMPRQKLRPSVHTWTAREAAPVVPTPSASAAYRASRHSCATPASAPAARPSATPRKTFSAVPASVPRGLELRLTAPPAC